MLMSFWSAYGLNRAVGHFCDAAVCVLWSTSSSFCAEFMTRLCMGL